MLLGGVVNCVALHSENQHSSSIAYLFLRTSICSLSAIYLACLNVKTKMKEGKGRREGNEKVMGVAGKGD